VQRLVARGARRQPVTRRRSGLAPILFQRGGIERRDLLNREVALLGDIRGRRRGFGLERGR
jgi:hypothetical protein